MRCLILGAGGIGGYFGGRLLAAGRDVTFLVRPARAARLAQGLRITSPRGDLALPAPPLVTSQTLTGTYDVVMVSCKAYDLENAIDTIAPAVGRETVIVPLLNGFGHLDTLRARFGAERVLGGYCLISVALDGEGGIAHFNQADVLRLGEIAGGPSERLRAIGAMLGEAGFDFAVSDDIVQEMWEKWVFIATTASATCLMRAAIGDIIGAGAGDVTLGLLAECEAIASDNGHPPGEAARKRARDQLTDATSPIMASMLRDIERGGPVEADAIQGEMLRRAGDRPAPLLRLAHAHLRAYEARRARQS
ncbi:2-dehydropantoate 2-reductase [Rhodospirillum rubrum]|uniref:2-dehydropantoate 2-reductase n=1 Tax=Rhodospirillum rubrum TaxID=1085 RepID=UPI0019044B74|nr:2-dehydropantoate 2-reductase [Rhodospirillum rubrum]MBK1663069.1 2-dehydropantoate 2-reductase [Rhodospirillum rubrum]MBK1675776.1 2-dehydropantoate 2-reductase [Rhodospirillum rubrum]